MIIYFLKVKDFILTDKSVTLFAPGFCSRVILPCLFIIFLAGCNSSKNLTSESIEKLLPLEETKELITTLSADEMQGRNVGTFGIEKAAVYIETYLRESGVDPMFGNSFRDNFTAGNEKTDNVVGIIPGTDKNLSSEYILIGAHYDHLGMIDNSDDMIYNGANDNASGVTTVMQIASAVAKFKPRRSVIVALFSAEEKGTQGSAHLAEKLSKAGKAPACVINVEMVGIQLTESPEKVYLTGFKKSNMATRLNTLAGEEFIQFLETETRYALFYRSDNYPFFKQLNIPAHTISTFDFTNYKYYHHTEDEVEHLDMQNMNTIIKKLALAVAKLANEDHLGISLD
ncbi:MAG: peptidase M28 [Bacteroidetes bacterium]|nr:MAG: peptidase M28 [Bacteroidota bacterium]